MNKPTSLFAAYQQVLDASRTPYVGKSGAKDEREDGQTKVRYGQGGPASDRFTKELEANIGKEDRNPNWKYAKGRLTSPFHDEEKAHGVLVSKSGIFSTDEGAVTAALEHGVKTNKPVQSSIIPLGYYEIGLFQDSPKVDVGMIDALCWQCLMGCERNVKLILKYGYDVPRGYSGLNPITAALRSKNLEVLKTVLAYPPIRALVNKKDGFGTKPLQAAASVPGIDPYEFARELIRAGANDMEHDGEYSAAMMVLLRCARGAIWTPNIFGEMLSVTDQWYKTKDGETLDSLAKKTGNRDAERMLCNFSKFGRESLNDAVLDGNLN